MRARKFERVYARFYAWLLRAGLVRTLSLMTAIAIMTSVSLTALLMWVVPGPSDFFWYGITVAVVSPLLSAPVLSLAAVHMVYRLQNAQTALAQAAETDSLTGIANRRSFMARAEQALARTSTGGPDFAVLMLDLDHFKAINDQHGHGAGDDVLRRVAQACQGVLRSQDCFARFGGEEFVALLEDTDAAGALNVAEKLRRTVCALAFGPSGELRVTTSLGIACSQSDTSSLHDLLNEADRNLYAAKAAGRNRTMATEPISQLAS